MTNGYVFAIIYFSIDSPHPWDLVLPEWLRDVPYVANWYLPMFGAAVVVLMVWLPDGLLSIPDRMRARRAAREASATRQVSAANAAAARVGSSS